MITTEAVYRTDDDSRFSSLSRAQAYEIQASKIAGILRVLKPRPDGMSNGDWVQQNPSAALAVWNALLDMVINEKLFGDYVAGHKWITQSRAEGPQACHPSWAGRLITDGSEHKAFWMAWSRISSIDWNTYREYDQGFWANHPGQSQGKQVG